MPAQRACDDGSGMLQPREIVAALKDLYIVSSALAQRGTASHEIRDTQWGAMAERVHHARRALELHHALAHTDALMLLARIAQLCQELVDRYAARETIPFAVWSEVAQLGREAYECISAWVPARPADR